MLARRESIVDHIDGAVKAVELDTIMHVSVHMKSAVNGSLFAY